MIYKLIKDSISGEITTISKIYDDGSTTNFYANEEVPHYQEYLEWIAEGNEPEEAE